MDIKTRAQGWAKGLWNPGIEQARGMLKTQPGAGSIEERLNRLEDEREVERAFRRYHVFYSGHDLAGTVACFTEDAVQINGRGTFVGRESIRATYDYLMRNQQVIFHHGTNVLVTLDADDPDAALLTARHIDFWVGITGRPGVVGGTYVNRYRRVDGRWLISEQRITFNYKFDVELSPRVLAANPPTPDIAFSQKDLLEDWSLLA